MFFNINPHQITSPRQIANCHYWLDADLSPKTYASANNVSQIDDLSGNSYNATASSNYPTYVSNQYNGKGVLRFLASSLQRMDLPSTIFNFMEGGSFTCILKVAKWSEGSCIARAYDWGSFYFNRTNTNFSVGRDAVDQSLLSMSDTFLTHTVSGRFDDTNNTHDLWVDGNNSQATYNNSILFNSNDNPTLGVFKTSTGPAYAAYGTLDLISIILYSRALNNAEIKALEKLSLNTVKEKSLKLSLPFNSDYSNEASAIQFSQVSGTTATFTTGKIGNALNATTNCVFDSFTNSSLNFDPVNGDTISFCVWFNTSNDLNTLYTSFFSLSSSQNHFTVDSDNAGGLRVLVRNAANTSYTYTETASGQGQTGWHMVSGSIRKAPDPSKVWTIRLWWDTTSKINSTPTISDYNVYSGNSYVRFASSGVSALYDQYYVWKGRLLTDDNITALYNSGNGRDYSWVLSNLP